MKSLVQPQLVKAHGVANILWGIEREPVVRKIELKAKVLENIHPDQIGNLRGTVACTCQRHVWP